MDAMATTNDVAMDESEAAVPTRRSRRLAKTAETVEREPILPLYVSANVSQRAQAPQTQVAKAIFFQDPTPLSELPVGTDLWQFPKLDSQYVVSQKMHPIGRLFHENCDLIKQHWGIEPDKAVPQEMRSKTPYSQALFLALRWLASNTKFHYEIAQKALLSVWQDRTGTLLNIADSTETQILETRVDLRLLDPSLCESVIQECNYGLTLDDVLAATGIGKRFAKGAGPKIPTPTGVLRGGNRAVQRAEKKAERERKKEQRAQARNARDIANAELSQDFLPFPAEASKITKNQQRKKASKMRSKVVGEKGYKLLQFLQGEDDAGAGANGSDEWPADRPSGANVAPPNSPELNSAQPSNVIDLTMSDPASGKKPVPGDRADPAFAAHATKQDRHTDNWLSQMFNRVDMDSNRDMREKKKKKLVAAASQRQGSLPVDRIKLGEITSLYAQQGMRRETEALEGLDKLDLSQEQQETVKKLASSGAAAEAGGNDVVNLVSDDEEL